MKKILKIIIGLVLTISSVGCSNNSSKPKIESRNFKARIVNTKIDTLKRNEQIVYNVTKDTLIGNLKISVTNKNIYEKYIHQDFHLNDSIVVRNYYPEMESIIKIERDNEIIFEKSYLKNDFPTGTFSKFISSATIKDFRFEAVNNKNNEITFIATLYIPNTDFENDFHLKISEKAKSKFEWIDYESE